MKILALDFSTSMRSVAVLERTSPESSRLLARNSLSFKASQGPIASIETALQEAGVSIGDVGLIAVGVGPGSYTGIRASLALAQGWQLGRGTPVAGVQSPRAIAAAAFASDPDRVEDEIGVVIDAQRREFYLGLYIKEDGEIVETELLSIVDETRVRSELAKKKSLTGPDLDNAWPEIEPGYPGAEWIARLADIKNAPNSAAEIEPVYLRNVQFVKTITPLRFSQDGT